MIAEIYFSIAAFFALIAAPFIIVGSQKRDEGENVILITAVILTAIFSMLGWINLVDYL